MGIIFIFIPCYFYCSKYLISFFLKNNRNCNASIDCKIARKEGNKHYQFSHHFKTNFILLVNQIA